MKVIAALLATLAVCLLLAKIITRNVTTVKAPSANVAIIQTQSQIDSKFIKIEQKYISINSDVSFPYPCQDVVTGKRLSVTRLLFRILTLKQIQILTNGKRKLLMQMDGYPHDLIIPLDEVLTTGNHATDQDHDDPYLLGLFPVLEDKSIEPLRKQFENKTVWSFGGGSNTLVCPQYFGECAYYVNGAAFKVKRIYHIIAPFPTAELYSTCGGRTAAYLNAFSRDPLLVVLDSDANSIRPSLIEKNLPESKRTKIKPIGYYRFCDKDHFHQVFTTQSPYTTHPEWPHQMRRAVLNGELRKGMTREMVAWSVGWPFYSDAIPMMKKKDEWNYYIAPSVPDLSLHFRKDKLVDWSQ